MRSGGQRDQVRTVSRARDCRDPSQMHIGFHMVKLDLEWCRYLGWCKQFSRLREMLMVRVVIFKEGTQGTRYATRYPAYTRGKRDRYRRIIPFRTGRLLPGTLWEVYIEFTGSVQCLCEIAIQTAQRALEVLGHPVGYVDARIRTRNESDKELYLSEVSRGEVAVSLSHGVDTRAFQAVGRAVLVRLRTDYRPLPACGIGCISTMLGLGAVQHKLQAFLQPKTNLKTLLSGLLVQQRRSMDAMHAYFDRGPEDDGGHVDAGCAFSLVGRLDVWASTNRNGWLRDPRCVECDWVHSSRLLWTIKHVYGAYGIRINIITAPQQ